MRASASGAGPRFVITDDCPFTEPEGRWTTRVSRLAAGVGQHGTVGLPGVRFAGYALGQKKGEIRHSIDI